MSKFIGQNGVVEACNIHQQIYALSTFEHAIGHYTGVAIGCKTTVQLVKLFPEGFNCKEGNANNHIVIIQLTVKGQENFSITDVCWSPSAAYDNTLAVCTSNGTIYVYSVPNFGNELSPAPQKAGGNYKLEWESSPQDFRSALNMVSIIIFYIYVCL